MKQLLDIRRGAPVHWVGDGFPVRTLFSYQDGAADVDPFLLLDYAAPHKFEPAETTRGVGEHPHRGFETVTVVFQGELEHRDSGGAAGRIGPGDVQWMTAASGVVHEEFHASQFTRAGGMFEVFQLWVNLPAKFKMQARGYQTLLKDQIPTVDLGGGACQARVIAGEHGGVKGPAKTFTPIQLWDVTLSAGKPVTLPMAAGSTTLLAVRRGRVRVGDSDVIGPAECGICSREDADLQVSADEDAAFLLMNGQPIGEPVVGYGPFVMNSQAEIRQAVDDFRAGRMGKL